MADEAIAAPVRRLDESRRFRIVAERFPNLAYADLQNRVGHRGAGPAGVEQLFFRYQLAGTLQKVGEHCESLRAQRQGFFAAPQPLVGCVQAERGEDDWLRLSGHHRLKFQPKLNRFFTTGPKTPRILRP
jgi:hypothetical protein